jgi:hypothetical protein
MERMERIMKKTTPLRFAVSLLVLGAIIVLCLPQTAKATSHLSALWRFTFSFNQGYGSLLTRDLNEGYNAGMALRGSLFGGVFDTQECGTIPLYRWRVQQNGRAYWFYTTWGAFPGGNGYYFEWVTGYVLPIGDSRGTPIYFWYSQRFGTYYTSTMDECKPDQYCGFPNIGQTTYVYQGVGWYNFNANPGGNYSLTCTPPPPPPPTCDGAQEQSCYNQGGSWDASHCTCTFPPPDPCRQGDGTPPKKGDEGADQRPVMPCRPA